MNTTMQKTRDYVVAALALVCIGWGPSFAAESAGEAQTTTEKGAPAGLAPEEQEARQVAIMGSVLETRLWHRMGSDLVTDGIFESGGVTGLRIPDVGAVFLANVKFPLAEGDAPADANTVGLEDSLWDRVETEAGFAPERVHFLRVNEADRMKIKVLQEIVSGTLKKNGNRLSAIDSDESLIALVGGGGGSGRTGSSTNRSYSYYGEEYYDSAGAPGGRPGGGYPGMAAPYGRARRTPSDSYIIGKEHSAALRPTQWVMKVSKSGLVEGSETPVTRMTQAAPGKQPKIDKEVAVMSRILETELDRQMKGGIVKATIVQRGVQGFYVPGVGALFFVEAKFPLTERGKGEAGAARAVDNMWDLIESELEGKPAVMADPTGGILSGVDENKMHMESAICKILARFGPRMESLPDNERIVVVVTGKSGAVGAYQDDYYNESPAFPGGAPPGPAATGPSRWSNRYENVGEYPSRANEKTNTSVYFFAAAAPSGSGPATPPYAGGEGVADYTESVAPQRLTTTMGHSAYSYWPTQKTAGRRVRRGTALVFLIAKKDLDPNAENVSRRATVVLQPFYRIGLSPREIGTTAGAAVY